MNSGGIRNSIEIGNISFSDMMGMMPFSNTVDLITLTGRDLKTILEFSARGLAMEEKADGTLEVINTKGGFLQVSGNISNHSELMQYPNIF